MQRVLTRPPGVTRPGQGALCAVGGVWSRLTCDTGHVALSGRPSPAGRPAAGRSASTIYTVAERAGVSHQTVSRYLRGESLRPANRKKVEQALASLDFQVNDLARALATRAGRMIGALMPAVDDWAPQRLIGGASEAAREAGYLLDVVRVDPGAETSVRDSMRAMNRGSVAGVVVLSPSDTVLEALDLGRLRVPWVVELEPQVTDDASALRHPSALAVEHLVSLGHRTFFHAGGPQTWLTARNRRDAYHAVLRRHGLDSAGATEGEWGPAAGYAAMQEWAAAGRPSAIVAASDQIALGVLHWLWERGVAVPDEVSVTGYDGIPDAAFYPPPLTTVGIDFAALGRHTVHRLLDESADAESRPDLGGGPAALLVRRGSTGSRSH